MLGVRLRDGGRLATEVCFNISIAFDALVATHISPCAERNRGPVCTYSVNERDKTELAIDCKSLAWMVQDGVSWTFS